MRSWRSTTSINKGYEVALDSKIKVNITIAVKDNDVKQLPNRIYQQLSLQLSSGIVCANFLIIFLKNGTDSSFQMQKESLSSELI
jgi:hypothetical protein